MKKSIKVKFKRSGKLTKVKMLIKHPMETGLRINRKTNKPIPAHFIQEVTCKHNDKLVIDAVWGVAVSKNPYMSFFVENSKPGDVVTVAWKDNLGHSDSISKNIS